MTEFDLFGVTDFLNDHPGMSIFPSRNKCLIFKGVFSFSAKWKNGTEIEDSYNLQISIPEEFPDELPKVTETGQRIPRVPDFHINPDGTLCLASLLRLLKMIHEKPTLSGFAESCLVPYLHALSYKLMNGGEFLFGELAHGVQGIVNDYIDLFGLRTRNQVIDTLNLLGMKKQRANKKSCPCGCGKRVGACQFHHKLNDFRKIAKTSWFRNQKSIIEAGTQRQ